MKAKLCLTLLICYRIYYPIKKGQNGSGRERGTFMKHIPSEKSNVAWFKLAEFVGRGERERTFSLYRLLTHSLDDQAFLKKLEADLWVTFDQKEAEKHYTQAAHLYKKEERWGEAIIIYELLLELRPHATQYLEKIITLCDQLSWDDQKLENQKKLSLLHLENGKIEKGLATFKLVEKKIRDADLFAFYQSFTLAALTHKYTEQKTIKLYLHKSLDALIRVAADDQLTLFLESIKVLNGAWHKDAVAYLKEQA